jgi:hypothetical protein
MNKIIALSFFGLLLSGCNGGSSGGGNEPPVTDTSKNNISGTVSYPMLSGATVFIDKNNDAIYNDGEPRATTDENGKYTIINGEGTLTVINGKDAVTGSNYTGLMKSSVRYDLISNINALTGITNTIVRKKLSPSDKTSEYMLNSILNTQNSNINIDPLLSMNEDNSISSKIIAFEKAIQILSLAESNYDLTKTNIATSNIQEALAREVSFRFNDPASQEKSFEFNDFILSALNKNSKTIQNYDNVLRISNLSTEIYTLYENIIKFADYIKSKNKSITDAEIKNKYIYFLLKEFDKLFLKAKTGSYNDLVSIVSELNLSNKHLLIAQAIQDNRHELSDYLFYIFEDIITETSNDYSKYYANYDKLQETTSKTIFLPSGMRNYEIFQENGYVTISVNDSYNTIEIKVIESGCGIEDKIQINVM